MVGGGKAHGQRAHAVWRSQIVIISYEGYDRETTIES